jgi:hypothetical protein
MAEPDIPMDDDIAEGIAMLEQILEVMPQDIDTLKALYGAYSQSNHREKAFDYLGRLANVVDHSHDTDTVEFIVGHLEMFSDDYPSEVAAHTARIKTLVVVEEKAEAEDATEKTASGGEADISEELALAWKLYEENQLSQEEYSSVLHDLTEVSSKELDVPVSVMHVLNDRGFTQMNRILNYMSSRSNVPCLSLLDFELDSEVVEVLPMDIPAHEGALPFAFFGDDLLVAVLNPFNNLLLDKVEQASGRRCHSYLVMPEEYDTALGKLRDLAA